MTGMRTGERRPQVLNGRSDEEVPGSVPSSSGSGLELIKDGTLTVGSDIPSAPFEFGDPPDYEGFDIDLINAIAADLGLELEIVEDGFDTIVAGQWEGRYDFSIASASITDERENVIEFGDPYFETEQSLLVREDGAIQSIDDITADTVVGAEAGTTGETYAKENTDAEVRTFKGPGEIDALVAGKVEAVFQDMLVTVQAVEDKEGLKVVQTFPTSEQYGIVFLKDSPLVEPINQSLQRLKDDGTLAELYMKWFDHEPPESLTGATQEAS
jgi:ABC-type amino acid transport substrate-binding protein